MRSGGAGLRGGLAANWGAGRFRFRRGARGQQRIERFDPLQESFAGQRRREHIALRRANAELAQIHHLLEILHALGHDVHTQASDTPATIAKIYLRVSARTNRPILALG